MERVEMKEMGKGRRVRTGTSNWLERKDNKL